MIFEQVVLKNFGLYKGRQVVDLTPPSREKPIILFGGLNGSGKTTLLDALQLGMFGKLARCSNRGRLAYEKFLHNCIHLGADVTEGAGVEIAFSYHTEGQLNHYRVKRYWKLLGKGETVEVFKNESRDRLLSNNWEEYVENFLPSEMLELFFFDGEKISDIADLERTPTFLRTAVHSLLGLEIVDRLESDLSVLGKRKRTEQMEIKDQREIEKAESELAELKRLKKDAESEERLSQAEVDRNKSRLTKREKELLVLGGGGLEKSVELKRQRDLSKPHLRSKKEDLVRLAAGPLPMLLVTDLLKTVVKQSRSEDGALAQRQFAQQLAERDAAVLAFAAEQKLEQLDKLAEFMERDRETRQDSADKTKIYLQMDEETREETRYLLLNTLPKEQEKANHLLEEVDTLQDEVDHLDRELANIPHPDTLLNVQERVTLARQALQKSEGHNAAHVSNVDRLKKAIEQKGKLVKSLERGVAMDMIEAEEGQRILDHIDKVSDTMKRFKKEIKKKNFKRLEGLIGECYQTLLRKDALVGRIEIDPETFELQLFSPKDKPVSSTRLSAGEKQLLAVAILWGLAKASRRPLPCIIDTPLGRLDSSHRSLLLERYYPFAGEQVVLLSTDKEIDEAYYKTIRRWVGRSYRLVYDEVSEATSIQEGYFWELEEAHVH